MLHGLKDSRVPGVRKKEGIDFDLSILNSGSWILAPGFLTPNSLSVSISYTHSFKKCTWEKVAAGWTE